MHPTKTALGHQMTAVQRTFDLETQNVPKDSDAYKRAKATYDDTMKVLKNTVPAEDLVEPEIISSSTAKKVTANQK